jgi:hemerythrin superfamily protein
MATEDPDSPQTGDVVDLILEDHRRMEDLLRSLRDVTADRAPALQSFAALHVAHAEAEEQEVYPRLRPDRAVSAHDAGHGVHEHREANEALLKVMELGPDSAEFDDAVEELSGRVEHHLAEEELSILNPARTEVDDDERRRLGAAFARSRDRLIREGCGTPEHVRRLIADESDQE